MTEAQLMECVRSACKTYRLDVFHVHDSRRSWGTGYPDLTIIGSRIIWREAKSATGRLSSEQVRWRYRIEAAGGDWGLWRPADWPGRILAELEAIR